MKKPAFVAYCMHQFCFRCIRHWAQGREDCPVCRQSLEQVLHSVRVYQGFRKCLLFCMLPSNNNIKHFVC
uniref:RING-type domain-containing protein n=1 Tax=Ficedula albicollis TaxID=59894 RepID=A0A803W4Z9_FICAL